MLAPSFEATVIARGNSQRRHTRIKVLARDESHIIGLLRDRDGVTHSASWSVAGERAAGACSCAECSSDGVLCPHLWMLAREAEHSGALAAARDSDALYAGTTAAG